MDKPNIQISKPCIGEEECREVRDVILSGWITQGKSVFEFEQKFAKRHKVKYALATTSCTTGLHLILTAMNIGPGDEVIVPAFTWVATANVVVNCGATPVFIDVERDTYNIDPQLIAAKVTNKTKAIIPVHLFGLCADIDSIRAVIPKHVKIIEDAACATGSIYKGQCAGTLGDAAAFSFHPRKVITTGEGGMVVTNDDELAKRMNQMRNHGASIPEEQRHHGGKPYILPDFNLVGFNYRMTDMQGAIGVVQLDKLDNFIEERAKWAKWYKEELSSIDWLQLPKEPKNYKHSWQSFVVYVDQDKAPMSRNKIMENLQEKGISTRPGTHAVHMLTIYRERLGTQTNDFPISRDCDANTMAIPLHNLMVENDFKRVVNSLRDL
jgi:dTDP-4-amino-4,6-dideoxygalactose transaminase